MVQVTMGNNVDRKRIPVDENITLKQALEDNGFDYTRGVMHLDGASLEAGDLNKTFAELGVTDRCYLLSVQKADNAR